MKMNYGVLFKRKSGEIVKVMNGYSSALMIGWALTGNIKASEDFVVFDEDGTINFYCEGKKDDMPNVCKDMEGKHIDTLCEGLLEAVKAE